jgi:hypothetical protein
MSCIYIYGIIFAILCPEKISKTLKILHMKALNLINLYNAEIKKSLLSNVRGGADVKCNCGNNAPSVAVYSQVRGGDTVCLCPDGPNYNSTKNKTGMN